ncbi:MAG TPA: MarR family transcriptional regulator [Burkholderiaceae bacterium]|nr:MarR family transcriptional regulator [Burkholderiaceae bacterium]
MEYRAETDQSARRELANRLFFRLYQCANMLHKTGSRAVEAEGLTTQQWAVLGALSRPKAEAGMSVGELARYLMVTRQNLSGLISRRERDRHITIAQDGRDRRSRRITMTASGRRVWQRQVLPKIYAYYDEILADFSINDMTHALHYLLKMLQNMQRLDKARQGGEPDGEESDDTDGANLTSENGARRVGAAGGVRWR